MKRNLCKLFVLLFTFSLVMALTPGKAKASESVTRKFGYFFSDDSSAPFIQNDTGVDLYYQVVKTAADNGFDQTLASKVAPTNGFYFFDVTISDDERLYIHWEASQAYGPVNGGRVNSLTFSLNYADVKNSQQSNDLDGVTCDSVCCYTTYLIDLPFDDQTGTQSWSYSGPQENNIAQYEVVVARVNDDWTGPTPCDFTSNNRLNITGSTGTYSWQGQSYNYWHSSFANGVNNFNLYSVIGTYFGGQDGVYVTAIFPCQADGTILHNCGNTNYLTIPQSYKTVQLKSVSLSSGKIEYTGSAIKPALTVKDANGKTVSKSNYKVTYSNNKSVGIASLTVTGTGKYTGTITKKFQIIPKKTSLASLTGKSKSLYVTWKKITAQTTGYEIQYSTKKSFTASTTKRMIVTENSLTKDYIRNLKSKTGYYVRIRTYKLVESGDYTYIFYSGWSGTKYCKAK